MDREKAIPHKLDLSLCLDFPLLCFILFHQACFKFRHSVGAIGGKPNHAYYFIGFYGKYMVLEGHFKFFILWTNNP